MKRQLHSIAGKPLEGRLLAARANIPVDLKNPPRRAVPTESLDLLEAAPPQIVAKSIVEKDPAHAARDVKDVFRIDQNG